MKQCIRCEREFENLVEINGEYFCEDCIKNLLDEGTLIYCNDCGALEYSDNAYFTDGEYYICESCYDNNYHTCDRCGRVIHSDDSNWTVNDNVVCDSCRDNYYDYCEGCNRFVLNYYAEYCEDDDCYYCPDCYPTTPIYDYHGFSNWHEYHLENEEPPYYIGFELEVENHGSCNKNEMASWVTENYNAICSRDGSLDDGFEIVSHPQSYNYIVEHQDKLKNMLSNLSSYGFVSHEAGTCGLHFHVTNPQNDDIINRIILIMETYKEEMIKFSRRTSSQIESWCKFLSDIREDSAESVKSLYYIKKNKETSSRYMALNLTNSKTIEFRIFRGTLNFDTFMASVELVNNIMTMCSNLEIPIEEITWDRLTETQYTHTYCDMRNIRTTIIPHSNDEKYIELEKKTQKFKKKVSKEIDNIKKMVINSLLDKVNAIDLQQDIRDELYKYRSKVQDLENIVSSLYTINYMCEHGNHDICSIKDKIRTALRFHYFGECQEIKEKLEKLVEER